MRRSTRTTKPRLGLGSRAAAWAVALLILATVVLGYARASWASVLYAMITNGALLLVWLGSAWGWGALVARPLFARLELSPVCAAFRYITETGLGLGCIGFAVLSAGLAGILGPALSVLLLIAGIVFLIALHLDLFRELPDKAPLWLARPARWGWLWVAVMPIFGQSLLAALTPPGILWGGEPNGYDVVEYHLQVPRQWYDAGKIEPLKENVFSYFPFGVEAHYLLAMEMRGGPWRGMYLAQLMHLSMSVLAVASVWAALPEGIGTVAGLLVAATPWTALLAPIAYVEGGVLLYGSLCLGWMLIEQRGGLLIAGVMAGLACGVKLPNLPMLLVPAAAAYFVTHAGRKAVVPLLLFFCAGIVVFSPWLIRNWCWARNPVFPEAMSILGHQPFSDSQVIRWQNAYLARETKASALWDQFLGDARFGYLLIPLALTGAALAWRVARARFLALLFLTIVIIWLLATHLQSRFLVLVIPLAAYLVAQPKRKLWTPIAGVAAICLAGFSTYWMASQPQWMNVLSIESKVALFGRENLDGLRPFDPTMAQGKSIYLVGGAYAFWYQAPSSQLHYRTVFDVRADYSGESLVDAWLGSDLPVPDQRVIVIDPAELERLSKTYQPLPPLDAAQLQAMWSRPDVYIEK